MSRDVPAPMRTNTWGWTVPFLSGLREADHLTVTTSPSAYDQFAAALRQTRLDLVANWPEDRLHRCPRVVLDELWAGWGIVAESNNSLDLWRLLRSGSDWVLCGSMFHDDHFTDWSELPACRRRALLISALDETLIAPTLSDLTELVAARVVPEPPGSAETTKTAVWWMSAAYLLAFLDHPDMEPVRLLAALGGFRNIADHVWAFSPNAAA